MLTTGASQATELGSAPAVPSSAKPITLVDALFELRQEVAREGQAKFERWRPM